MMNKNLLVVIISLACVVFSILLWRWSCYATREGLDAEAGPKYDPNDLGVADPDERGDITDAGDITGAEAEQSIADQVTFVNKPIPFRTGTVLSNTESGIADNVKELTPGRLLTAQEVAKVNEDARKLAMANGEFGAGERSLYEDSSACGNGNILVDGVCLAPKSTEIENNFPKGTFAVSKALGSVRDGPTICSDKTELGYTTDLCYGNIRPASDQLAFVPTPFSQDPVTYKANWNVCDDEEFLLEQINTCTQKSEEQDLPRFVAEMSNTNKHLIDRLFP